MRLELKVTKEFDVKFLGVSAGVRYWEDATVNGVEDEEGELMPFINGEYWEPIIDVEKGIILDWPKGMTADIHYKVCDDGRYTLLDEKHDLIASVDGYVIDMLCPEGGGYGDYIIMHVDGDGNIKDFEANFDDFKDAAD